MRSGIMFYGSGIFAGSANFGAKFDSKSEADLRVFCSGWRADAFKVARTGPVLRRKQRRRWPGSAGLSESRGRGR